MRNAKRKKDPPAGKLDPTLCPQKMERGIDVFFESGVGTDGARTRNFRLDRAVLWPIELQSQVGTLTSYGCREISIYYIYSKGNAKSSRRIEGMLLVSLWAKGTRVVRKYWSEGLKTLDQRERKEERRGSTVT